MFHEYDLCFLGLPYSHSAWTMEFSLCEAKSSMYHTQRQVHYVPVSHTKGYNNHRCFWWCQFTTTKYFGSQCQAQALPRTSKWPAKCLPWYSLPTTTGGGGVMQTFAGKNVQIDIGTRLQGTTAPNRLLDCELFFNTMQWAHSTRAFKTLIGMVFQQLIYLKFENERKRFERVL